MTAFLWKATSHPNYTLSCFNYAKTQGMCVYIDIGLFQ